MSPFVTLPELARKYVAALSFFERTRKPERLKEFVVKSLGEVFEGAGTADRPVDPDELFCRERSFEIGTVPSGVRFLTAAVDVGGAKFDVLVRGWDLEGRSWLIDRFTLRQGDGGRELRPAERIEDWLLLKRMVLDRVFPFEDGPATGLSVAAMAVDTGGTGFRDQAGFESGVTWKAREFARRMHQAGERWGQWDKVRLIKGGTAKAAPEVPPSGRPVSVDDQGRKVAPTILEWTLNVSKLRETEISRLHVEDDGPGQVYFPSGLPRAAFDEMAGEVKVGDKWERRGANETLDLLGYTEAARVMLKPERATIRWTGDDNGDAMLPPWATPIATESGTTPIAPEPMRPTQSGAARLAELNRNRRRQ